MSQSDDGQRRRPIRHRGPITARGGGPDPALAGTTTDQRLLDRRSGGDFIDFRALRVPRLKTHPQRSRESIR